MSLIVGRPAGFAEMEKPFGEMDKGSTEMDKRPAEMEKRFAKSVEGFSKPVEGSGVSKARRDYGQPNFTAPDLPRSL